MSSQILCSLVQFRTLSTQHVWNNSRVQYNITSITWFRRLLALPTTSRAATTEQIGYEFKKHCLEGAK